MSNEGQEVQGVCLYLDSFQESIFAPSAGASLTLVDGTDGPKRLVPSTKIHVTLTHMDF